ncbi:MAG: hypothetical protein IKI64_08860 [Clostridia bacterium]|nr:hypothetical protein [Clostridia bacterium]
MRKNDYTIFASDTTDNRSLMFCVFGSRMNEIAEPLHFKLRYVPPYNDFSGIALFRYACAYKPFRDDPVRARNVIIDLSEWREHADEEYLEHFFAYLHDYDGYHYFTYVFDLGSKDNRFAKAINMLAALYLGKGEVIENKLGNDDGLLSEYIGMVYGVCENTSAKLAKLFNGSERFSGLTAIDGIMSDLVESTKQLDIALDRAEPKQLTALLHAKCPDCKLLLFFGEKLLLWQHEPAESIDKDHITIGEVA